MNDAPPPSNPEAEAELLGSLLAYYKPDLFAKVDAIIQLGDFYDRRHEIVYRAVCAVAGSGQHVDHATTAFFLSGRSDAARRSFLDLAGGSSYLAVLQSHAVVNGIVERAEIIRTDAEWRRRLREAQLRVEACYRRDEKAYAAAGEDAPRLRVVA